MKKTIILISIILFIIISALTYYSLVFNVEFIIKQSDLSVEIYNKSNKKISTLNESKKIYLLKGDYYYVVKNNKISDENNYFSINKNTKSIIINPNYSVGYLQELLKTESVIIKEIITNTYPELMKNYEILNMNLYNKGEWFGAIIRKKINPRDITDNYRIIMTKTDGKWKIINYPEILLIKDNYKNVPLNIINSVNSLSI